MFSPFRIAFFFFNCLAILPLEIIHAENDFVYFKNFVRHAEGDYCTHIPPKASFVVYLNRDQSNILIENAPRWESGGDPNITGKGIFGVELGNFSNPSIHSGDSVFIRFHCRELSERALLSAEITDIPWNYFPRTLHLATGSFPARPQNVSLTINAEKQRIIQWQSSPGESYSIYRRSVSDTVLTGESRMLYQMMGYHLQDSSFTDTVQNTDAHGYIVIPYRSDIWGPHSAEVVDFPLPPSQLEAAVAYSQPPTVSLTWIPPEPYPDLYYSIYRSDSPGVHTDSTFFTGKTSENYWLDSLVQTGATYYYRVVAENAAGIASEPTPEISITVEEYAGGKADLDILFISRSPKYPRFDVEYIPPGYNPHPRPGTEGLKHYPDPGEMITYTAVIRNSGGRANEGFHLSWFVDSMQIAEETFPTIFPRQRFFSRIQWPWNTTGAWIRCEVSSMEDIEEVTLQNNSLQIRSNALSLHFHAEENILRLFDTHTNPLGSFGFEDWAQAQIRKLNQFFIQAEYPEISPHGVHESVYLDTVDYYPNGTLPAGGTHAPHSLLWDGQWGFTGDENALNYFQNIVLGQNNGIDWALLHELGHQIGLIDLYNMDVQESEFQVVEPRTGLKPPLNPVAWDVLYYSSRRDYLMHSNFQAGLSDHSAGGLMRNLHKRRGYFGDYLADIPAENALGIRNQKGEAVKNAEIWIYQMQDSHFENVPKFRGTTDSLGTYLFSHVTALQYEGGMFVENPFSTSYSPAPHVVGTNSVLFIRVARNDSVGYGFIDICDFNTAYWSGHTDSAYYEVMIDDWFIIPSSGHNRLETQLPRNYHLGPNYPNPFNPGTFIEYQLPERAEVSLVVYNAIGQEVKRLISRVEQPAGYYQIYWNGMGADRLSLASGIYYYRLVADKYTQIRKMILLK